MSTPIVQAVVESYDSGTHTAVVRPLSHPTAALGPLPVAANIAPALVTAGARVLVLLYADVGGAVVAVV
ncbi:MAG: hypothetical protein R6X16_08725 [Anaerolineae bacterium]